MEDIASSFRKADAQRAGYAPIAEGPVCNWAGALWMLTFSLGQRGVSLLTCVLLGNILLFGFMV